MTVHGYHQDNPDPPAPGDRTEFVTCPGCGGRGEWEGWQHGLRGDPGEPRHFVCPACGGDGVVPEDRLDEIKDQIEAEDAYAEDLAAELQAEREAEDP